MTPSLSHTVAENPSVEWPGKEGGIQQQWKLTPQLWVHSSSKVLSMHAHDIYSPWSSTVNTIFDINLLISIGSLKKKPSLKIKLSHFLCHVSELYRIWILEYSCHFFCRSRCCQDYKCVYRKIINKSCDKQSNFHTDRWNHRRSPYKCNVDYKWSSHRVPFCH